VTAQAELAEYDTIVLVHRSPDPDCIGAATTVAFEEGGCIIVEKPLHESLAWIPEQAGVKVIVNDGLEIKGKTIAIVDCRDCGRIGFPVDWEANNVFLVVDHHEGNKLAEEIPSAKEIVVSPTATATCEILSQVFLKTKQQAVALASGMVSDSKNLTVGVTAFFLEALQKCVQKGANISEIQKRLEGPKSLEKELSVLKAKAEMLETTIQKSINGKAVVFGFLEKPFPASVQYLASFNNDADVVIRLEKRGECSFAGALFSEEFNAGKICELLGGGGHERNGGFTVESDSYAHALEVITDLLKGGL
jgi:nanoRNase/pAp phosphatase (c-di-AMP/oligoRNAs hydrolase)